jgi:hypothetical protein
MCLFFFGSRRVRRDFFAAFLLILPRNDSGFALVVEFVLPWIQLFRIEFRRHASSIYVLYFFLFAKGLFLGFIRFAV